MTSTERAKAWRLANPERWKIHQKRYQDKTRKPRGKALGSKLADKLRRAKAKIKIHTHKMGIGCSKCKYNKCGAALDWHHIEANKERRITIRSYFTRLGELERAKCILLCANCHREEHEEDSKIVQNGDVYK